MLVLFQDDVHLGISGGIAHIVSPFVETIKKCCFMLYINTVNDVFCFKSEIGLVSFSLTDTCIYFISNTQFQTVANVSRCLKCACHVHMQIYSLFYVNLM